jgi:hypothetical protein
MNDSVHRGLDTLHEVTYYSGVQDVLCILIWALYGDLGVMGRGVNPLASPLVLDGTVGEPITLHASHQGGENEATGLNSLTPTSCYLFSRFL